MFTTAIYNFKGGAFKTTATHHLATGLAAKGKRVLVIDTDPQGHVSLLLGVKPRPRLYDYLVRPNDTSFTDAAVSVPPEDYLPEGAATGGMIVLIPGNDETAAIGSRIKDPAILQKRLAAVADKFDYCLIDTPPTPSLMSIVTYAACDAVLYPTVCAIEFDSRGFAMLPDKRGDIIQCGRVGCIGNCAK